MMTELVLPEGVTLTQHSNSCVMAQALANDVAQRLQHAIAERGCALLIVSGGRSPIEFFQALAQQPLCWEKVLISLTDERWVPVEHPESNEALVRRYLLQGPARVAGFVGLYHPAPTLEQAAERASQTPLPRPDVLVLGMGVDGHCASLFPGNAQLEQALCPDCPVPVMAMLAPDAPNERLSRTLPILASARHRLLLLQGVDKLSALAQAASGNELLKMPVRAFLKAGLEVEYC